MRLCFFNRFYEIGVIAMFIDLAKQACEEDFPLVLSRKKAPEDQLIS